jgi:hypothetical protein
MISVGKNAPVDFSFLNRITRDNYANVIEDLKEEYPEADKVLLNRLANAEIKLKYISSMYYSLKNESTKWWNASQEAGNQLNQLILDARGRALDAVNTAVKSLNNGANIVFICVDNRLATDEGTIAQMNSKIRKLCPNVDSIIVARGNLDIKTMSDYELAKHGLLRIPAPDKWKEEKEFFVENALKLVAESHKLYDEALNGYYEIHFD